MIDIRRRGFLFGVTASLVVPPPKKFFILSPPPLIKPVAGDMKFDLPLQQMLDLQKRLDEQVINLSAIPRWVVIDKDQYDRLVA
jgi:hypothetical protein